MPTEIQPGRVLNQQHQTFLHHPCQRRCPLRLDYRLVCHPLVTPKNGMRLSFLPRSRTLAVYCAPALCSTPPPADLAAHTSVHPVVVLRFPSAYLLSSRPFPLFYSFATPLRLVGNAEPIVERRSEVVR